MMRYNFIILSGICILFFMFQLVLPAFTDSLVLNQSSWQQPWRFVSAIFLHGSASHLIFNLFALILFGFMLEQIIGSNKFLAVFLISGISANIVALNFYPSSLGASGAIYGILGCLTIIRPKMIVLAYSLPMPMFVASIIWIGVSIFGIFNPSQTGDIAHLSGIVVGFLAGFLFREKWESNYIKR
jgi:uncharacterized protein